MLYQFPVIITQLILVDTWCFFNPEITTDGGKSWDKYNMTNSPTSKTFAQKQIMVRFVMEGTTENRAGFVMTFQGQISFSHLS